ncbi:MAG: MarR family winged helix-turn-helix transcriptional regulator [Myxococcales bacterium]
MKRDDLVQEFGWLYPEIYRHLHARPGRAPRMTPQGQAVLHHLAHSGPLTVTEAARHFGKAQSVVSEIVDGLCARGFVERLRDERDRRRTLVWLTPEGQAAIAQQFEVLDRERLAEALARLSEAQRKALFEGMRALAKASQRAFVGGEAERPTKAQVKGSTPAVQPTRRRSQR